MSFAYMKAHPKIHWKILKGKFSLVQNILNPCICGSFSHGMCILWKICAWILNFCSKAIFKFIHLKEIQGKRNRDTDCQPTGSFPEWLSETTGVRAGWEMAMQSRYAMQVAGIQALELSVLPLRVCIKRKGAEPGLEPATLRCDAGAPHFSALVSQIAYP